MRIGIDNVSANPNRIAPPTECFWDRDEQLEACEGCRGDGERKGKPCVYCGGTGLNAEARKQAEEEEQYEEFVRSQWAMATPSAEFADDVSPF